MEPVTLDEIIQEAELTIDAHDRHWLASEVMKMCGENSRDH